MSIEYYVIIIGIGAMGSVAACHLAQRNKKVWGRSFYSSPFNGLIAWTNPYYTGSLLSRAAICTNNSTVLLKWGKIRKRLWTAIISAKRQADDGSS